MNYLGSKREVDVDQFLPPVKDMIFALEEIVGKGNLKSNPHFEEFDSDFLETIYESASEIASEIIAPTNKNGDEQGVSLSGNKVTVPDGYAEAYNAYVEGGWPTLSCNPNYGGQGMPTTISMPINEMVMGANFSWAHLVLLTNSAIRAIDAHANKELKDLYLEKLITGHYSGTMNLTEPQAGSDLSVLNTVAEPNGDSFKISGQKIFITWGEHELSENIIHLVLARLPDAPEGVKGISLFLVPKFHVNKDGTLGERNDVKAISLEHKLGIHGCATCVMSFEDATGYLVGNPNEGLACMFTMMNDARIGVACESVAIAERAYQQALSYAKERVQGTVHSESKRVTIIHHPDVRRMLLTMRSQIEVMRALVYVATAEMDLSDLSETDKKLSHKIKADLLTPITKGWCSEICQEITSLGIQIHGGMGYVEETGAAQHYRDSRITTIYEGTTAIQANDLIGRKFIKDKGQGLLALISE
ncbi:MAG: acyl-CoA dehydrogenase, partial [Gammaproteobacteria bacterium]|nr:acyl-CoA dehydrogenase [Gammaproteobacteria bacterium]